MSRANLIPNPITIMHILANHHPPPSPGIMAALPNPDPTMGFRSKNQLLTSDTLPTEGGLDLRVASDTWVKLGESEARLHLMVELGHLEVGFPDVENFCLDLESKYRATVTGELREKGKKSPEWKVVKLCMELKMLDERKVNARLETAKYKMRKKLEDQLGKNSRKLRNLIKNLRHEAARNKSEVMKKNEDKLKHLRRKFRTDEEEKINKIPESMTDLKLENLSIFNKEKFDKKATVEYEPDIIGEITLHDNERLILMLPPNFSIEENLPPGGLALDNEMAFAKARMTISKEEEEKLDDEGIGGEEEIDPEEEEKLDKLDAESRQVYDPKRRVFDDRKRRATDLQECARVTLPKPLSTNHEAGFEMRRGTSDVIYEGYRKEECNGKGEVRGNLTMEEKDGLRRLQKRIKEKEVVILKTDKSGKLCLATREEYERMGAEHTGKDAEIDRKGIIEKEKQLNGHVFFWSKMWGSGDAHNHRARIIDSKVVSSEQLADLYLMFKDHKEGRKSRPVVTGCSSNTRGFSNSVSDLLESVNKANQDPYECISSEDKLARIENFNIESAKIMEEGRKRLQEKMLCKGKAGINLLAGCNKLWSKKSTEARRKAKKEDDLDKGWEAEEQGPGGAEEDHTEKDCGKEVGDEEMRFRKHQYGDNPTMEMSGEDLEMVLDCSHCGPAMVEMVRTDCDGCGRGWVKEDYKLCIIGNDVVSLFPSLDSATTGRIVREEVTRSTMDFEGFNLKLGLRYIAMNKEYTSDIEPIRKFLPTRLTKPGVQPTMKCKWVNHKEILDDEDWIYPPWIPTLAEHRRIIGHVAEIGTRTIFENFCY